MDARSSRPRLRQLPQAPCSPVQFEPLAASPQRSRDVGTRSRTELATRRQVPAPRALAAAVDRRNTPPPRIRCAPGSGARGSRRRSHHRGVRREVVKLEKASLPAAALRADERAPATSRFQTSRLTAAGMWRDLRRSTRAARGRSVAANFACSRSTSSSVSARSKIAAGSPFGIECRKRSCTRRSLSCVSRDTVNCTL